MLSDVVDELTDDTVDGLREGTGLAAGVTYASSPVGKIVLYSLSGSQFMSPGWCRCFRRPATTRSRRGSPACITTIVYPYNRMYTPLTFPSHTYSPNSKHWLGIVKYGQTPQPGPGSG